MPARYIVTTKGGASVRAGKEIDSKQIGTLKLGQEVAGAEECASQGFLRVRITSPVKGWLSAKMLEQLPDPTASPRDMSAKKARLSASDTVSEEEYDPFAEAHDETIEDLAPLSAPSRAAEEC